ncbi:MAG: DUF2892 domain-containing protein [Bacteroidetes bacterium]|nr:DUF2892 domain-containing protein [Bacteroidota bacterium]
MKRNITDIEIVIRLFAGIAFASITFDFALRHQWNSMTATVCAILLVTALTGFCPLYFILGIHRHPRKKVIHKPSI